MLSVTNTTTASSTRDGEEPMTATTKPAPAMLDLSDIASNDVLLGRGKSNLKHPGNERFQEVIARHFAVYAAATKNRIKQEIVCSIIGELNGRFLRMSKQCHRWIEVDTKEARIKVAQALQYRNRQAKEEVDYSPLAYNPLECQPPYGEKSTGTSTNNPELHGIASVYHTNGIPVDAVGCLEPDEDDTMIGIAHTDLVLPQSQVLIVPNKEHRPPHEQVLNDVLPYKNDDCHSSYDVMHAHNPYSSLYAMLGPRPHLSTMTTLYETAS